MVSHTDWGSHLYIIHGKQLGRWPCASAWSWLLCCWIASLASHLSCLPFSAEGAVSAAAHRRILMKTVEQEGDFIEFQYISMLFIKKDGTSHGVWMDFSKREEDVIEAKRLKQWKRSEAKDRTLHRYRQGDSSRHISGWWFGTWLLFSHKFGMSSSQLTNSDFSEG